MFVGNFKIVIEKWKDITGYEGLYQVSSLGRVKRLEGTRKVIRGEEEYTQKLKGRIVTPQVKCNNKNTYLSVKLYKNNKYKKMYIHRLVAQAFLSNPHNKSTVNHKNGLKFDNHISNLEFMTSSEQTQHAYKTGLLKRKISDDDALFINSNYGKYSVQELAEMFEVTKRTIYYTLKHRKIKRQINEKESA